MKTTTTFVLSFLIAVAPLAMANGHINATAELNANAGVSPDSIFYGLDKAMERLQAAMARTPEAKARLHLRLAEERLAEMEAMANANKTEEAEEAQRGYEESVEKAESNAERSDDEVRSNVAARLQIHTEVLEGLMLVFEAEGIEGLAGIETALNTSQRARATVRIGSGGDSGTENDTENRSNTSAEASANVEANL